MKVLFMTNVPSPYRMDFFNELGKYCELTVTFEGKTSTERNNKWKGAKAETFRAIFLKGKRTKSDQFFCRGIIEVVKQNFDHIIIGNYSSPTSMYAIEYMRLHRKPFYLEADGGIVSQESKLKYYIKKHFISSGKVWFSSGKMTSKYFMHYGAPKSRLVRYHFTSLKKSDILQELPSKKEKLYYRRKLGMGQNVIISVGRFSYQGGYGKGYDVLLNAMKLCSSDYELYIIGDEPTEDFIKMREELHLSNVYFVGFKDKEALKEYYIAADLFCLQTRGDVWGLVINEAMSMGLPIITTNKCIAGLELVNNGYNGYIVPVEDDHILASKITKIMDDGDLRQKMSYNSLKTIRPYTIENMAKKHYEVLKELKK